jgi:hypothetical protein
MTDVVFEGVVNSGAASGFRRTKIEREILVSKAESIVSVPQRGGETSLNS